MGDHYFISYSKSDGKQFARQLADELLKTPPSIRVWLDERELQPGTDWDEQIVNALRECAGLIFLMTPDSVHPKSECKREWSRALRYKKPIIPLLFDSYAEIPYRLEPRQYTDFTDNYDQALSTLRTHMHWRSSPEGLLRNLEERLSDAERDLPRAKDNERSRIEEELIELKREIKNQKHVISNPDAARQKTGERIDSGLERVRRPFAPAHPETGTKFINPPPATAPTWFQDRHLETELVGDFLKDPALRLMTVVGRGGVGKTAMVCRLLKALEAGHLSDAEEPLGVDGILYLSPKGLRQINLAHLFSDLCKLLPAKKAELLEMIYKNPQATAVAKMQALLDAFHRGRTVVLLDNFEEVVDNESGTLLDQELNEALQALLEAPEHGIKVLITTRVAPRPLQLTQPGRQTLLELDEGLRSPFAENILKAMDADGKLGLRGAPDALLALARERTLGYPRALEALQAILAADRSTTLEEVLAEAEDVLPENVVEVLVGEAFNRLDTQAQKVMQALASLAAPVPEAAVDYLLQPYVPDINSAPVLRRLVNMLFARRDGGRFHLHQVDRNYALERVPEGDPSDREAEPPPFTRYALLHRAAEYFEQIRSPRESWQGIDDLAPQLAEFEVRVAGDEYDAAASVLLEIDFNYLMLWGHARLVGQLHERLKGRLTDQQLILPSLVSLGNCYFSLGDYPRAIDYYEQSLTIAHEIGDRYREGGALGGLGSCYYSLGDYPRAIYYYEQSLAIDRDSGDRIGEGIALNNLGNCHYSLGDYPRAIDYYAQSLTIRLEIEHRYGEGSSLGNLGLCYNKLGDYSRAIDHHERSLAIAREIGDRVGEGVVLSNLGICYDSLGDYSRAIDYHEQSVAIAREIGDRYVEGAALVNLGDTYTHIGQSSQAREHFQNAVSIADETGNKQNQHEAHFSLALASLLAGELTTARGSIETARTHEYPSNNAAMWTLMGTIRLRQEECAAACEAFSQGLAEANELLEKSDQNLSALDTKALALCGLALCEHERHLDAATEVFRSARKITKAEGVVTRVLNQFEALFPADTDGVLAPLRKAAEGD